MRELMDDPALTAYALADVSGPDRAPIEDLLASSPEMRREVEEIRATAASLTEALAIPPDIALDAQQQTRVEAEARRSGRREHSIASALWPALAAAAALDAVAVLAWRAGRE